MKKVILIVTTIIIVAFSLAAILRWIFPNFNEFFIKATKTKSIADSDKYILLNNRNATKAIAFSDCLVILEKGEVKFYDKSLNLISTFKVQLQDPIYFTNQKMLALADRGGKKVYTYKRSRLIEQKMQYESEMPIDDIYITEQGNVVLQTKNSIYRGILTYINDGKDVFNIFVTKGTISSLDMLPKTLLNDQYLAVSIVEYDKSKIESVLKIYKIEAKDAKLEKEVRVDGLIANIKYKDSSNLLVQAENKIYSLNKSDDFSLKELYKADDDTVAIDISSNENFVVLKNESKGNKLEGIMYIYNDANMIEQTRYSFDTAIKGMKASERKILVQSQDKFIVFSIKGNVLTISPFNDELKNYYIADYLAVFQFFSKVFVLGI